MGFFYLIVACPLTSFVVHYCGFSLCQATVWCSDTSVATGSSRLDKHLLRSFCPFSSKYLRTVCGFEVFNGVPVRCRNDCYSSKGSISINVLWIALYFVQVEGRNSTKRYSRWLASVSGAITYFRLDAYFRRSFAVEAPLFGQVFFSYNCFRFSWFR